MLTTVRSKTRAPVAQPNRGIPLEMQTENAAQLNKTPVSASNLRRRTRSQSRNQQKLIPSNAALNNSANNANNPANRRVLPFDLFLINLRYNRSYATQNETSFDMTKLIESLLNDSKTNTDDTFDQDLDRKEKLILNSQNLQIFLEQLCPHKRHIKLENLKSLNLSQNKIKKCSLMFDLSSSLTQINANNISLILADSPRTTSMSSQAKAAQSNLTATTALLADAIATMKMPSNSIEMVTSESDFSESEDSMVSGDGYSSNDDDFLNKSKGSNKYI